MSKEKEQQVTAPRGPGRGFGGPMGRIAEKPKDFRGTMFRLGEYLKKYLAAISLILLLAVGSTIFAITGPKILGQATDKLIEGVVKLNFYEEVQKNLPPGVTLPPGTTGAALLEQLDQGMKEKIPSSYLKALEEMDITQRPSIDFQAIGEILLYVLGIYVISALFYYIQGFVMAGITQKTIYRLRKDVNEKLDRLPMAYFDRNTHGEILSRVSNDIDTISNTLQQSLTQMIISVVTIVGIVIMMLTISPWLTLVAFLTLPLSGFIAAKIAKFSQKEFKANQKELGLLNSHVEEMFSGHKIIKSLNREENSITLFQEINQRLYRAGWRSQFVSGIIMPLLMFVSNLGYVAVAVIGGLLSGQGLLSVGSIQAFIQYTRQFTQPITEVANIANTLQSTAAAAERVFQLLDEEEEVPEVLKPVEICCARGAVAFQDVSFSYLPERPLIQGLNIQVEAGQTVAIVGPTGAGKTTLVNLLMRFYELGEGAITIDGTDIRELARSNLRKQFGMVLQDTWLFQGSIRDNIAYGREGATPEEVEAAARAAYVDHFIRTLEHGYDTEINEEGSNISAGQKQLLTIARAILADPPILILDEATSSVDTRTEVLIQKAMGNIMEGRTSFVIAHRLSTIRNADLILVMDQGAIVEQGTHESLLAAGGFYHHLYNSQFAAASTAA